MAKKVYIFVEQARELVGRDQDCHNLFKTHEIPFVYIWRGPKRRKRGYLLSAVEKLAEKRRTGQAVVRT